MYLKSLDIYGFKSFADKTRLEFHKGVTGIVGPNGCGKSNVVDAIRWVLGETSAKALRGGAMADVIFNGTEKRKPLGMAEVTLTLADCEEALGVDYNEIAVTRRVYRDGKSEYRLNGTLCRLRDINNLFADTGIGNTAYSIMAQGQIDQILSSKPEERRAVFEEAAGITKYKREKRDALRKLEYTEANLLRVGDVLAEQERRMNSLKRQVSKARRYQSLAEEVRILDTHLGHKKYIEMNARAEESRVLLRSLQKSQEHFEQEMEPKEQAVDQARTAARNFEAELSELRQTLNEHQNALSTAEGRIAFNTERKTELQTRITQNEEEITSVQAKLTQQKSEVSAATEALSTLVRRIAEMEISLKTQEEHCSSASQQRSSLEQKHRETRTEFGHTQAKIAAMQAKLESIVAQLASSREREKQLTEEQQRLEKELAEAASQQEEIEKNLQSLRSRSEDLQATHDASQRQYQQARGDLDVARNAADQARKEATEGSSRLEVLEQLLAGGEGLGEGTKKVLEGLGKKEKFSAGIHGALANSIEVENDCARAIEVVLDGYLQAVLVEDSALAESIIHELTEQKMGRARVLPQEFIAGALDTQMETVPEGAVAWALDRVKIDPKVQGVIQRVLERVLIVPDLATGIRLRKEMPDTAMVSLNGEMISHEGIVLGGVGKKGKESSILKRQNEVRALKKNVVKLQENQEKTQQAVTEKEAELARLQEAMAAAQDRMQQHKIEISTLDGQCSLAKREVESLQGKLENVRWESEQLEKREQESRDNQGTLEMGLVQVQENLGVYENSLSSLQSEVDQLRSQEEEHRNTLHEMQTALAVERRAKQAQEAQQQPMEARLAELNEIAVRRETEISSFRQRITDAATENEQLQKDAEQHRTEAKALEENITAKLGKRGELMEAIQVAEEALSKLRKEQSDTIDRHGRTEVALTKVELRLENLEEAIRERHNIELEAFKPDAHILLSCIARQKKGGHSGSRSKTQEADDQDKEVNDSEQITDKVPNEAMAGGEIDGEPDWQFVESCVTELKRKLDSMGPVNIDAIEEFEELEDRHNEVKASFEDLTASKTELLEVIEKINEESLKRFTETFAQIRENFKKMFKELFGAKASADLSLVDEDDPLESGIDVIAKPPGKKLQSITLLSGGERSMTAVALLFSIYMCKPSPFSVLDELDAPLDESNNVRFVKVLDYFVKQSQFIIVTHSKRTMSRADVIYGVTMEEFGVSKPVGMRMTSADGNQGAEEDLVLWS